METFLQILSHLTHQKTQNWSQIVMLSYEGIYLFTGHKTRFFRGLGAVSQWHLVPAVTYRCSSTQFQPAIKNHTHTKTGEHKHHSSKVIAPSPMSYDLTHNNGTAQMDSHFPVVICNKVSLPRESHPQFWHSVKTKERKKQTKSNHSINERKNNNTPVWVV